jgi:PAS domain S-box-containing protein
MAMPDWKWSLEPTFVGMRRAIETMGCGVIVEDVTGTILYVNQRVLEWTGYDVPELDGLPVEQLIPEELRDKLADERKRVHEGDCRTRLSAIQRKDGRTFPVAVAPQPGIGEQDGGVRVMSLVIDLGELQTARPMGFEAGSLAAELASVAQKLHSMSFSAAVSAEHVAPVDHPLLSELSNREREILEHLMSGSRVPAIAKELFISPNTVRNHLKSIYRKVDVSSQAELIELVRSLTRPTPAPAAG